jgi:peptidoglycan/LPS O-acetylase OafA/YrhL
VASESVPASAEATQRFDGVDVLRGLSIVAVVIHHSFLRLLFAKHSAAVLMPRWLSSLLFWNGNHGVTVFFAISGFLITYTCVRRFGSLRDMQAFVFYRIRFARIAPLLLAVLAVLNVLSLLHTDGFVVQHVSLLRADFAALTFHLNWLEAAHGYLPANWDVLWSLSVEEMFYVFFPVVCLLLLRLRAGKVWFVLLLLAFVAMGPFARTVWAPNPIWQEKTYLGGMDAIAMGCITALLLARVQLTRKPADRSLLLIVLAGMGLWGAALWPGRLLWHTALDKVGLIESLLALGTCCMIFGTVARNRSGRVWTAPLRWFGRHSYEVYLTHEFVVIGLAMLALHVGKASGRGFHYGLLLWIALMLTLSAPLGWVVAKWFSEPLNRRLRMSGTQA